MSESTNLPTTTSGARADLHDGYSDGFTPTAPLDLSQVNSVDDMLRAMSRTAFGARNLGEAANVLEAMVRNPNCFVVCTVSGAMTVAKMGLVLCDMIDHGMVHAVISTGALMAHGFVESTGRAHFKYQSEMDDKELYYKGYNRVYDTLELEKNLDDVEEIFNEVLGAVPDDEMLCSYKINRLLGAWLMKHADGRGILRSACEREVPVFVPAFSDSELGLDFALLNRKRALVGKPWLQFNPFVDLEHYTQLALDAKTLGIFTIGGGVPRNWGQQVGPFLEIIEKRLGPGMGGAFKRFQYGVRLCPEPAHWGGLSGCTYSEGISWGKFVPPSEGGRFAEVMCDATIAWPLVVKAVEERIRG